MNKVNVITRSYSNTRDGANLAEAQLTALYVQKHGLHHQFTIDLPGDRRGTEGMPLLVANLTMGDEQVHDVLFVASMSNDVRAIDATAPDPETGGGLVLWERRIGNPLQGSSAVDWYSINDHWGVLSTPAIDLTTQTLYLVCMTNADGQFTDVDFKLHALSLIDGSDRVPPIDLNRAVYNPGHGLTPFTFGSVARKQRAALLFDSFEGVDTVFIACGSFLEDRTTNQGWVIACDVSGVALERPMEIAAAWTATARWYGGGIWMGGQGPSLDENGYLYVMTGNGSFDGVTDFGESFVKLQYTPKGQDSAAKLEAFDWFSPFTDTGCVAGAAHQTLASVALLPAAIAADKAKGIRESVATNMNDAGDMDLNSGGPLLLLKAATGYDKDVIIGAGKHGFAYVLDANNLGRTQLADFAPDRIHLNYARLLSPVYGFTYWPAGVDLQPTDLSTLPTTYGGYTHHQHSTPVFYKSPRFGPMLFTGGENAPVRAFRLNADYTLTYLGCGDIVASAAVPPPGGMPGTMMTLSANGGVEDTAVLWCLIPYGDANKGIVAGRLVGYGADWIDQGRLLKIWDSQDWNIPFSHNKFNLATVANGRIYVPTYSGTIEVFGWLAAGA